MQHCDEDVHILVAGAAGVVGGVAGIHVDKGAANTLPHKV